ncbi:TrlF family AAA-like ATPase [Pseudomonas capsici]|uniref:AAA family ATPase n=1 Tax=Pseudomonas capsici TaxID=2810614 RepID=A0ABT3BYB6_9PSED|nr:AAA family ATPase [Pseudomonas capsici]MBN6715569.1 AAA family ATPase [Pseudomonas capsici]MBN6720714.1 AAA family ATPase [Pseudomonas capsici]MBN6725556.1 AAA family ATPase [Pseudomonas capsici]MCV4265960.1 AAA family ATPase [Pseudomonas capsici]MCV4277435.1 AAA family ATPase [Pseudomonas capsici]
MGEYHGMRWFKADFQVQTPEDNRHWRDDGLRLGNPRRPKVEGEPSEEGIRAKARTFLLRCHELELQIVGFTDHNFSEQTNPRDWFLTHLIELNKAVAHELGREPIHILPGFEVDIGYHVLCLFEPAKKSGDLERVNRVLTQLGLPEDKRFEKGIPAVLRRNHEWVSLAELLKTIQDENNGIVIAAHADSDSGLLERPSNRGDYNLPELLAVEVTQFPLSQKVSEILRGKNREWSRPCKQPAYVQSSDAKSLKVDVHGNPLPNALGYRSTWVKCSMPSIAALKQAFLDPGSRLKLGATRPSDLYSYPQLSSVRIKGLRYLEDQDVQFSPNLNCLIGARGSGKSTILELLRIMFARDDADALSEKAKAKVDRAKETFTEQVMLEVDWHGIPGQCDTLRFTKVKGLELIEGDAHDLPTYLRHMPVQFYSQQQLSELTAPGSQPQILEMIDEVCTAQLEGLYGAERTLVALIGSLFADQDQAHAISSEMTTLKQELVELDRQWQARHDVQAEAQAFQRAQYAKRYFTGLIEKHTADKDRVQTALENLTPVEDPSTIISASWPHADWFTQQAADINDLRADYKIRLEALISDMKRDADRLFNHSEQWAQVSGELEAARHGFTAACEKKGIQPNDVARMQEIDRTRQSKQSTLDAKAHQWEKLEGSEKALADAFEQLATIWEEQFALRKLAAEEITRKTNGTIKVQIKLYGYSAGFMQSWMSIEPDRRSRLGKCWDDVGGHLWKSFLAAAATDRISPWEHLTWLLDDPVRLPEVLQQLSSELIPHLAANMPLWRGMRVSRVPDLVDIELHRADGSLIGSLSGNQLSEGQRNTAILNLLLVKGDGPLVIDQPEDEVDASFIYRELVPLLRQAKTQRQIILATHNANLPVNADSEFVYALESVGGRGRLLSQGGMDVKTSATAVLDIMEGSEEAFQRRHDKYHF